MVRHLIPKSWVDYYESRSQSQVQLVTKKHYYQRNNEHSPLKREVLQVFEILGFKVWEIGNPLNPKTPDHCYKLLSYLC